MFYKNKKFGFSIVEIIVGVSIALIVFLSVFSALGSALQTLHNNTNIIKAGFLLEEGLEAFRILRDSGWQGNIASLSIGTNYYFSFNEETWQTITNNVYIDGIFERKFIISNVYRDVNDDIVASGTLNPDTKKVTIYVSWLNEGATTTKSISAYFTNLFKN